MRRFQLVAVLIGGLSSVAMGNILNPGTCLATPSTAACAGPIDIFSGTGLTLLANRTDALTPLSNTFTGTLISAVYRETAGTLDFLYQIHSNAGSTDPIARITANPFTGFMTDAGYLTSIAALPAGGPFTTSGTNTPLEADRSSDGSVVGFQFFAIDTPNSLGNRIQAGQTSSVLVIKTNATNFKTGFASVIDGGTASVFSYAPTTGQGDIPGGVPEPATFGLMGAALVGVAAIRRRTRKV